MGFLDQVIKVAKTAVWVSIAVFFVTCTAGAIDGPDVDVDLSGTNFEALENIDSIEIVEHEADGTEVVHIVINRKGEE